MTSSGIPPEGPAEDGNDLPEGLVIPDDLSSLLDSEVKPDLDTTATPSGVHPPPQDSASADHPEAEDVFGGRSGSEESGSEESGSEESDREEPGGEDSIVRTTAVVLTAVRQAKVLAGLMALQGIEAAIVPSGRGAIAVRYIEQAAAEVDPNEALSGIPREAEALGAALSLVTRSETVLLAAHVDDVDGMVSGQVTARRYRGGQVAEDPPPGLVLASADQVAERLLIGLVQAPQIKGYISSSDIGSTRLPLFRRRRGTGDGDKNDQESQ